MAAIPRIGRRYPRQPLREKCAFFEVNVCEELEAICIVEKSLAPLIERLTGS